MNLRVTTAPTVEPVSTDTAKAYLHVDGTADDTLIASLIKAARDQGEQLSRRAFITQTLELILDEWPADNRLILLRPPLQSITSVKYKDDDGVELTWTDYVVDERSDPGVVIFRSLPTVTLLESGGIAVAYKAGYGAASTNVPDRILQNILALVAFWYENREIGTIPADIKQKFMAERSVWWF